MIYFPNIAILNGLKNKAVLFPSPKSAAVILSFDGL
jgi:hypothetical protein